jgi:Ribonuclease G/E
MVIRTKDAGLRLRVERDLREEFVETCRLEGKAAAQVLREYMREYVARNKSAAQRELFSPEAGL